MKITAISTQIRNKNRVNISIDGKYRLSLDIFQVGEMGLRIGKEYNESELLLLEAESQFGRLYGRALDYCLVRTRSEREMRDYLYRKTRPNIGKTGELRPGISPEVATRVINRLQEKGYIDDRKFAYFWVENRSLSKGISRRKLVVELRAKGVDNIIIEEVLGQTERNDNEEILKIISKKRLRYPDDKKLTMYLLRLGFRYDDIKSALK